MGADILGPQSGQCNRGLPLETDFLGLAGLFSDVIKIVFVLQHQTTGGGTMASPILSKRRLPMTARIGLLSGMMSLGFGVMAAANECPSFPAYIVSAESFKDVTLYPGGDTENPVKDVGFKTPLRKGDLLEVTGASNVLTYLTHPNKALVEVIETGEKEPVSLTKLCDKGIERPGLFAAAWQAFETALAGPLVAKPTSTLPKRSLFCGEYAQKGLVLDLDPEQWVVAGQSALTVHWLGLPAAVSVTAEGEAGGEVLFATEQTDDLQAHAVFPRALAAGEDLKLELRSVLGTFDRTIKVVAPDTLPAPEGVQNVDSLTGASATAYAIWLVNDAPPEWRLQGMTLLAEAAQKDHVALKVWRSLWAEQECTDDF